MRPQWFTKYERNLIWVLFSVPRSFFGIETPAEDVNCPLEVLKLVPKDFLKEHLSRR